MKIKKEFLIAGSWFMSNLIGYMVCGNYGMAISNIIWALSLSLTINVVDKLNL